MAEKLIAAIQLFVGSYFLVGGFILAGRLFGSSEGSALAVAGLILLAVAAVGAAIAALVNVHRRRVAVVLAGVLIVVYALIGLSGYPVLSQPL